jgi:hypothetical protein
MNDRESLLLPFCARHLAHLPWAGLNHKNLGDEQRMPLFVNKIAAEK